MELIVLNRQSRYPEEAPRGTVNGMEKMPEWGNSHWSHGQDGRAFACGYCGVLTSGYMGADSARGRSGAAKVRICNACNRATFFDTNGTQTPGTKHGREVAHLPKELDLVYEQARNSMAVHAYMGVALICRTLLMHICCQHGAKPRETFSTYLDYLIKQGLMAEHSRKWFEQVTTIGSRAAHRLEEVTRQDAERILDLIEHVLQSLYEHPIKAGQPSPIPNNPLPDE